MAEQLYEAQAMCQIEGWQKCRLFNRIASDEDVRCYRRWIDFGNCRI